MKTSILTLFLIIMVSCDKEEVKPSSSGQPLLTVGVRSDEQVRVYVYSDHGFEKVFYTNPGSTTNVTVRNVSGLRYEATCLSGVQTGSFAGSIFIACN